MGGGAGDCGEASVGSARFCAAVGGAVSVYLTHFLWFQVPKLPVRSVTTSGSLLLNSVRTPTRSLCLWG